MPYMDFCGCAYVLVRLLSWMIGRRDHRGGGKVKGTQSGRDRWKARDVRCSMDGTSYSKRPHFIELILNPLY